jgi:Domain of unknown function (DUF4234)
MAEEIQIAGTGSTAKIRNPIGTVALSIITLGIYYLCWWYFINREMRDLGRARNVDLGQNPTNSLLALFPGAIIIVPAIVTLWTTSGRIESSQEAVGIGRRVSGPIIFILLLLIGPVGIWYAQSELNKVWEADRSGGAGGLPQPETAGQPAGTPPPPPAAPEAPVRGPEAPAQSPQSPEGPQAPSQPQ